jgi:hypothetical protein
MDSTFTRTALIDHDVAFRQHRAGHTSAPNWPAFPTSAGRYFTRSRMPAGDSKSG